MPRTRIWTFALACAVAVAAVGGCSTAPQEPVLTFTKAGTFADENANTFADAGETIDYTFTLTNDGTANLTNITIDDPLVTVVGGPLEALAVGASDATTFSASYTLTTDDVAAGEVTNVATATSDQTDPTTSEVTVSLPPPSPVTFSFANTQAIEIAANGATQGPAFPYPSPIFVTDMPANIIEVSVTLEGLNHTWSGDLEIVLVSPRGDLVVLLSDLGGTVNCGAIGSGADFVADTVTFDRDATDLLTTPGSGTFLPTMTAEECVSLVEPAPQGPYQDALSIFDGTDPNGFWDLYVFDDVGADFGSITNGWSLTITSQ